MSLCRQCTSEQRGQPERGICSCPRDAVEMTPRDYALVVWLMRMGLIDWRERGHKTTSTAEATTYRGNVFDADAVAASYVK